MNKLCRPVVLVLQKLHETSQRARCLSRDPRKNRSTHKELLENIRRMNSYQQNNQNNKGKIYNVSENGRYIDYNARNPVVGWNSEINGGSSGDNSDELQNPTSFRDHGYENRARYVPGFDSSNFEEISYTRKAPRVLEKAHPESEWLYGRNVIEAALKAQTRKMYKLFVYDGQNRQTDTKLRDYKYINMAKKIGVKVVMEHDEGVLDAMCKSRPHNGYVLECSPLLKPPILSLGEILSGFISLQKAQHAPSEGIFLNNVPDSVPVREHNRNPFILMLDSILDPQNLGAIVRSAYYLGCSAVILSSRNCAPLSPTALKASAGASEFLPLLTVDSPHRFVKASSGNGWQFFAAVPPLTKNQSRRDRYLLLEDDKVRRALRQSPTVLVMGGEGEGLRDNVRRECQYCVSISRATGVEQVVDSLNVSVAAAVLCNAFLAPRNT